MTGDEDPWRTVCAECGTPIELVTESGVSYWVHRGWVEECKNGPILAEAW